MNCIHCGNHFLVYQNAISQIIGGYIHVLLVSNEMTKNCHGIGLIQEIVIMLVQLNLIIHHGFLMSHQMMAIVHFMHVMIINQCGMMDAAGVKHHVFL